MEREELIRIAADLYDLDADMTDFIRENPERYFTDETIRNIMYALSSEMRSDIDKAVSDYTFDKEHENNVVRLDRDNKLMFFDDDPMPAYWYKEGMNDKEVEQNLKEYREVWADLNFKEGVKRPLFELWNKGNGWLRETSFFPNTAPFLDKMERDLECADTEEAKALHDAFVLRLVPYAVRDIYPFKIDEILAVENRKVIDGEQAADITMRLTDGSICSITATGENGRCLGMSALGERGFPWMTDRDRALIEKALFEK